MSAVAKKRASEENADSHNKVKKFAPSFDKSVEKKLHEKKTAERLEKYKYPECIASAKSGMDDAIQEFGKRHDDFVKSLALLETPSTVPFTNSVAYAMITEFAGFDLTDPAETFRDDGIRACVDDQYEDSEFADWFNSWVYIFESDNSEDNDLVRGRKWDYFVLLMRLFKMTDDTRATMEALYKCLVTEAEFNTGRCSLEKYQEENGDCQGLFFEFLDELHNDPFVAAHQN